MEKNLVYFYLIILCIAIIHSEEDDVDYYWRDYTGTIPKDAFPAGKDANGKDTYVGQVYIYGYGLFVGQIFPGKAEVEASCNYYVYKLKDAVKILCTQHKRNFFWLPTTSTSFHLDTIGKHVVVGGYHGKNQGTYGVGRLMYNGILQIGGVVTYKVDHAHFYFVHKEKVEKVNSYEVLIYNRTSRNTNFDVDRRGRQ
ncbi:DUF3421 domain containing protein [Asbolus verrucosus]|uniref:DUF3421 domain containing protein n=1 Tax=Asbolus verrucosus TaxID=1661398 RepID=A0A482VP76_ASBVE|nr:DUF3421 domain containing protein [Asbolus verrucosus]